VAQNSTNQDELLELVSKLSELLQQQKEPHVPLSIFSSTLSPAEALVKHLKEDRNLSFADVGRLLNRDQRGIWCTYQRASEKYPRKLPLRGKHAIPTSLFKDRTLSILEHVVNHLRTQNIPVKTIAELVAKSPSTIAAVHHRARRKLQ